MAKVPQFLDVVVIEQTEASDWPGATILPDGLTQLQRYNLMTFKSHHESLTDWSIKELIGYYVSYRKQLSEAGKRPPQTDFGLYAVSHHYPQKLANYLTTDNTTGLYQLRWGSDTIQLIVLSQIDTAPRNDLWHLFSHQIERVRQASQRYRQYSNEIIYGVVQQLLEIYSEEEPDMAYTLEQFTKEFVADHLNLLSADEVLQRYSPDEVLQRYSPDERLKDLSPDEIAEHLSPEALQQLLLRLQQKKQHH
ncbi:hypothetical protein D5085_03985 [Ectothiorhodospiraceae bacterium BW-2]|nr:hypothetical protein D5085_03985 [Ectothiorhodospiraceae bacterium BW-2]